MDWGDRKMKTTPNSPPGSPTPGFLGRIILLLLVLVCTCTAQDERARAEKLMQAAQALANSQNAAELHRASAEFEDAAALWHTAGETQKQIEALYRAAWTHYPLQEYAAMLPLLEGALALAPANTFGPARAELLNSLAVAHFALGEFREAAAEDHEAGSLYESLHDANSALRVTGFEGNAWRMIALAAEKAQDPKAAIEAYRQAALLFQKAGDSKRAGIQYLRLGQLSEQQGTPAAWEQAADSFRTAVPLLEAGRARPELATTWWALGDVLDSLGRTEQSRDALLRALPLLPDLADPKAQAIVLKLLAGALAKLGDNAGAIVYYDRALPLFAAAHDSQDQFIVGMKLGKAHEALGQKAEALKAYEEVAAAARSDGDRNREATAHISMGLTHQASREWQAALNDFSASQKLHAGMGDKAAEALDWGMLGVLYASRGQYKEKLRAVLRELELLAGGADRRAETQALIDVGDCYNALNLGRQAIEYLEKARAMASDDAFQKAAVLVELGEVYYNQTRLDTALALEKEGLDIALALDKPAFVSKIRIDLGRTLQAKGEMGAARETFETALADAKERKDLQQTYAGLHNLARLHLDLGDTQESVKLYEESLAMARGDGDMAEAAKTLDQLGTAYHRLGQDEKAFAALAQSDAPREAGGLMGWAASKAVGLWV